MSEGITRSIQMMEYCAMISLTDLFQPAYKEGHSTETVFLRA